MKATLIGATGLIGNYLLEELLKDDFYHTVRILIRRPIKLIHPKLEKKLVDFTDAESFRLTLQGSDVVFCAIGTTRKKVKGDKDAYRKVDYDITINAAKFCKMNSCDTFVLVSSVGANSKSNNFYLKLKGEVEDGVNAVGLKSVHIMRPSVLLGNRKEFRLGEKISKAIMSALSFFIPSNYKPIHARNVAKAMVGAAKESKDGIIVYKNNEIINKFVRIIR
ncbi:MAG TPA: NAD(P)H-binding protein [Chitinophagaceae bacterium]|nr:NAD(P)H-binding protein [Chitinophagaceae bacterium]